MKCAHILVLGIFISLNPDRDAFAIYCANCSTFYQQMFEYAEAVNTALNTAEQLSTQVQQYNNMVKQGTSLPSSMFGSITQDLKRVASIYNRTQVLGRNIADLDSQFNMQFPGYQTYLRRFVQSSSAATDAMPNQYETWSAKSFDNARTALHAAGINTGTFGDEDTKLEQLVNRSQSSVGRMQAIQAGNEIAASNVQQLQKLRDLVATQINLQGNYVAQETERQSVSDAATQQFRSRPNTRGPSEGF